MTVKHTTDAIFFFFFWMCANEKCLCKWFDIKSASIIIIIFCKQRFIEKQRKNEIKWNNWVYMYVREIVRDREKDIICNSTI